MFISGMSHYFRAVRWKILLDPLGHKPKTSNTFFAVMVGYLANFAIHRIGEVTRCGLLTKYEKVPFTEGFGSVIAERAFDMVCLILIFFLIFALEFTKISGIANDLIFTTVENKWNALMQNHTLLIILAVVGLMVIAAFFYFRKKIKALISGKIIGFLKGIWEGLLSIKNVNKPYMFIFQTILIWLMYILQVYVCFFAFPETANLSFTVAMVITVFGSLGIIAVPGGTGAYQIIVIQILTTVYAITSTPANAFAWSVWASQFILIVSVGFISLILLGEAEIIQKQDFEEENFSNKKKTEVGNTSPEGKVTVIFFVVIAFIFIFLFSIKNQSEKSSGSNSSENAISSPANSSSLSYDKNSVFNQGFEDYTNSLKGGITLSNSEKRMVFDVKFPNGTDADFQNYKNGCTRASFQWNSNGNHYKSCEGCNGTGWRGDRVCPMCKGKGKYLPY